MKFSTVLLVSCAVGLAAAANSTWHPADDMLPLPSYHSKAARVNGNGKAIFSAYIVDWAHYRKSPWTYTAESFQPIAHRVDVALYSFIYFCPPAGTSPMPYWAIAPYGNCNDSMEYQLLSVDPKDDSYIPAIVGYGPKVVFSVGGWNFPSEYFSKMASSSASRGKFVNSVKSWMSKYGAHGVDLDWEYPCSEARTDPVKITCTTFRTVEDKGGKCPDDNDNLLALVKDLRAGLGADAIITIASQAGRKNAAHENLHSVTQYIDAWHVMSYDYAVSDIPDGSITSPNSPLYMPRSASKAVQMSVNDTMAYYLSEGVAPSKIHVGLPLYAHTWYVPGLKGQDQWGKFGLTAQLQGQCCGPFKQTYGAKYGQGCQLCGSYMYSEILAAGCPTMFDKETQSDISYCETQGKDGYTAAGTWMTYNSIQSAQAFVKFMQGQGFAGIFVYSTDMDTNNGGQWTYQYMNAVADAIAGVPPTPPTPPPPTPPPVKCGTWTEVCSSCTGSTCVQCKSDPAKWQCGE